MTISSVSNASIAFAASRTQPRADSADTLSKSLRNPVSSSGITATPTELLGAPPTEKVIAPSGVPVVQIPAPPPVRGIEDLRPSLIPPGTGGIKPPPEFLGPPIRVENPLVETVSKQIANFIQSGKSSQKIELPGNLGTAIFSSDEKGQINIFVERRRTATLLVRNGNEIINALQARDVPVKSLSIGAISNGNGRQPPVVTITPSNPSPIVKAPPVLTGPPVAIKPGIDQPTTQPVGIKPPVESVSDVRPTRDTRPNAPGRIYENFLTNGRLDITA